MGSGADDQANRTRNSSINKSKILSNEKAKTSSNPKCPGKPPIDDNSIKTLAGVFEVYAHIIAIQARIDGMNTANICNHLNDISPQYKQQDFLKESEELRFYAKQLHYMTK